MKKIISLISLILLACPSLAHASATPNKGYELQNTGTNRGIWGVKVNNIFSTIDKNIAGVLTKDVSGNSNISVSDSDAQNLVHKLTGTLTGNIEYVLPNKGGFYIVSNASTGSFTIKVTNVAGGTGAFIPQGETSIFYSDAANNAVNASVSYFTGALKAANNLSDVASVSTSRTNLGLGALAVLDKVTTTQVDSQTATNGQVMTANGTTGAAWTTPAQQVPVGTVSFYAGTTAPSQYVLGYGQTLSRTTYSALFSAISTTYGPGDGSTTFNIPDCRGRSIAGIDNMGGTSANRLEITTTMATTNGNNVAAVTSVAGLAPGMFIYSTNVAAGTTITDISGGNITMSANASATASGTTVRFSVTTDPQIAGATGGELTHKLTIAEMPSHHHNLGSPNAAGPLAFTTSTASAAAGITSDTGGDLPHNNLSPTLVMNCIIYTGVP